MRLGCARWGRMESCMITSTFLQTRRGSCGKQQVRVPASPFGEPRTGALPWVPPPLPTWCLRKRSHICWKAFLCSCEEAAGVEVAHVRNPAPPSSCLR